jgi:hypothetical protein
MWSTLFLIGAWLTCTPLSDMQTIPVGVWQNNETTSCFLAEFSVPMDTTNLINKNNYSITDIATGIPLTIQKIGKVQRLEDINISGNKLVVIITNRVTYKKSYMVVVTGVKSISGSYIQGSNSDIYYFNGMRPSFKKSIISIEK